jgi:hypothetical protein
VHGFGHNFVELAADNFLLQVAFRELEPVTEKLEVFAAGLEPVGEFTGLLAPGIGGADARLAGCRDGDARD